MNRSSQIDILRRQTNSGTLGYEKQQKKAKTKQKKLHKKINMKY